MVLKIFLHNIMKNVTVFFKTWINYENDYRRMSGNIYMNNNQGIQIIWLKSVQISLSHKFLLWREQNFFANLWLWLTNDLIPMSFLWQVAHTRQHSVEWKQVIDCDYALRAIKSAPLVRAFISQTHHLSFRWVSHFLEITCWVYIICLLILYDERNMAQKVII
jgi:hypothetical protein